MSTMSALATFRGAAAQAGRTLWREASGRGAAARAEMARRAALAREAPPEGVRGPPLRLLMGELRHVGGLVPPPRADHPPAQRPRPVMLLPGFGTSHWRLRRMAKALAAAGHATHDWGLGFNLGPTVENFAALLDRIAGLAERHRDRVALVGWSLGGLFARELAKRQPTAVSAVITMGTPFSGDLHANNAWRAYQLICGHPVHQPPIDCNFTEKPPVPTIALWSPRDGIVAPRSACGRRGERDRAVALRCSHLGFAGDPSVIAEVLRQLDQID
jgi:pimeloyl-ACP methyl ester carboxylesterase